jgi:hypothetical protein
MRSYLRIKHNIAVVHVASQSFICNIIYLSLCSTIPAILILLYYNIHDVLLAS